MFVHSEMRSQYSVCLGDILWLLCLYIQRRWDPSTPYAWVMFSDSCVCMYRGNDISVLCMPGWFSLSPMFVHSEEMRSQYSVCLGDILWLLCLYIQRRCDPGTPYAWVMFSDSYVCTFSGDEIPVLHKPEWYSLTPVFVCIEGMRSQYSVCLGDILSLLCLYVQRRWDPSALYARVLFSDSYVCMYRGAQNPR